MVAIDWSLLFYQHKESVYWLELPTDKMIAQVLRRTMFHRDVDRSKIHLPVVNPGWLAMGFHYRL